MPVYPVVENKGTGPPSLSKLLSSLHEKQGCANLSLSSFQPLYVHLMASSVFDRGLIQTRGLLTHNISIIPVDYQHKPYFDL